MKPKPHQIFLIAMAVFLFGFIGCQSKFSEPVPKKVQVKGLQLKARMEQKEKIDLRINQIQKGTRRLKKLVGMFSRVAGEEGSTDVFTVFDFLSSLNDELKNKIPQNEGDSLVRHGKIKLPKAIDYCSAEIDIQLKSTELYERPLENQSASLKKGDSIGTFLTYSIKHCGREGYLDLISVLFVRSSMNISFETENINRLLGDIPITAKFKNTSCEMYLEGSESQEGIVCRNFDVILSSKNRAFVDHLHYAPSSEEKLTITAKTYEDNVFKSYGVFKISDSGQVSMEPKEIEVANE